MKFSTWPKFESDACRCLASKLLSRFGLNRSGVAPLQSISFYVLLATFTMLSLSVLHVPNATLLAAMAAVFDILPLIGFFLAIIPALIIAISVSPGTAGLVLLFYTAYHLIENYLIVPRVRVSLTPGI